MSDIHILTQRSIYALYSRDRDSADVIFHFAVPDVVNQAGVNYRDAIKQWSEQVTGVTPLVSECPFIDGAELTNLQAGIVYEVRETVNFPSNANDATKLSIIQARWNALNTEKQAEFTELLKQWGRSLAAS